MYGYVYVGTGKNYQLEANRSASSLRLNTKHKICIITDSMTGKDLLDKSLYDVIILVEDVLYSFRDKLLMHLSPFENSIFLDTDTLIIESIDELFEPLSRYEIGALPEVSPGLDYKLEGVPSTFPEYTTGVICFKKSNATSRFFNDWALNYDEMAISSIRFIPDQPSFRKTLYQSEVRHFNVPPEYHVQADFGSYLFWKARLIHCHHNQETRAREINDFLGPRAWSPIYGTVQLTDRGNRALLMQMFKIIGKTVRYILTKLSR